MISSAIAGSCSSPSLPDEYRSLSSNRRFQWVAIISQAVPQVWQLTPLYESSRRGYLPIQVATRDAALNPRGFYTRERFVATSTNEAIPRTSVPHTGGLSRPSSIPQGLSIARFLGPYTGRPSSNARATQVAHSLKHGLVPDG